jgi:hypothetical protein
MYSSPDIRVIKSRRMRWPGHVAHAEKKREMHKRSWSESLKERNHLEDLDMVERITLKWLLQQ